MVKILNPTDKIINPFARLNGRWFDGIKPSQVIQVDEEKKVVALLKRGCEIVKEAEVKINPKKSKYAVKEHPTEVGISETDLAQEKVRSKRKVKKKKLKAVEVE